MNFNKLPPPSPAVPSWACAWWACWAAVWLVTGDTNVLPGFSLGASSIALSDVSVLINPSEGQRKKVVRNIVRSHKMEPIADCELVGPIPWDLIVSKEAARLKDYDCPYCGEFDAVLMPSAMAGNTVMKVLTMSANVNACGVLAGTRVPCAIASRSSSQEQAYLSLCVAAAMLYEEKK